LCADIFTHINTSKYFFVFASDAIRLLFGFNNKSDNGHDNIK